MKWYQRKNGISVLISTQNEEALVSLCIRSLIDFGDELIVVDNGSTDRTKEIVQDLQSMYPTKIKFYDVPELPDLYHNRQYAFSKSSYRWVVRTDADFVAYTDGKYNIMHFREMLLSQKRSVLPKIYAHPLPNVTGDFWHTGLERKSSSVGINEPGRYIPPPVTTTGGPRVYEVFPGFRFQRLGRWEGVRFNRLVHALKKKLDYPLWMHCNLKSNRSYLFRSERTNWRQLGDFVTYPTLESYLRAVIQRKYGTSDIDEAAELYLQTNFYPFLQKYNPEKHYPYPELVQEQMQQNPIYKIAQKGNTFTRIYTRQGI